MERWKEGWKRFPAVVLWNGVANSISKGGRFKLKEMYNAGGVKILDRYTHFITPPPPPHPTPRLPGEGGVLYRSTYFTAPPSIITTSTTILTHIIITEHKNKREERGRISSQERRKEERRKKMEKRKAY